MSGKCNTCSRPLEPDARFCAGCGSQVLPPPVQYCRGCGQANEDGTGFCRSCGQPFAAGPPADRPEVAKPPHIASPPPAGGNDDAALPQPLWKRPVALVGGGVIALALVVAGWTHRYEWLGLERPMATAGTMPAEGEQAALYVTADANVRDKPTARGTSIKSKIARGTRLTGTMRTGEDGKSLWLKLADGTGYVGAINLSGKPPPTLSRLFNDGEWFPTRPLELRAAPDMSSAVLETAPLGAPLVLAGLTDTGFAEAKLKRGGVGYFLAAGFSFEFGGKPIEITLSPSDCSYGQELGSLFATLEDRRAGDSNAALGKAYSSDEERDAALLAVDGKSRFETMNRSFQGLNLSAIGQHYESTSLYFKNDPGEVRRVFNSLGFVIGNDSTAQGLSVTRAAGEGARYGQSELSCGL
jgi:Double zinc ribbon